MQFNHKYPTGFSHGSFKEPKLYLMLTKYAISSWDPPIWNGQTNTQTRSLESVTIFKTTIKNDPMEVKDGFHYF